MLFGSSLEKLGYENIESFFSCIDYRYPQTSIRSEPDAYIEVFSSIFRRNGEDTLLVDALVAMNNWRYEPSYGMFVFHTANPRTAASGEVLQEWHFEKEHHVSVDTVITIVPELKIVEHLQLKVYTTARRYFTSVHMDFEGKMSGGLARDPEREEEEMKEMGLL